MAYRKPSQPAPGAKPAGNYQLREGPARRPAPARPVFPLEALGPALASAVSAAAARTQAPPELIAPHLLTLAAMCAQRLMSVRLPTGAVHPASAYFLTMIGAGEGRSAAERLCVAPLRPWETKFTDSGRRRARPGEPRTMLIPGDPDASWENGKPYLSWIVLDPPAPDPALEKPVKPFANDNVFLTPARSGIYDRYARFARRAGLFAGIAADILTPSGARRNEAESLAALWEGRPARDGAPPPRLSLHLSCAPPEAFALMRAPEVEQSGLLGCILVARPASRIGAREFYESDGAPPPELDDLHARLTDLYAAEAAAKGERMVALDAEAKELWFAFARECEAAMADGAPFAAIRPLAGHLAAHAARLAGLIALLEDRDAAEIAAPMLARGIALARFYADEALGLQASQPMGPDEEHAAHLQAWLEREKAGQDVSLRDIYRAGLPRLGSRTAALRAMQHIEDAGLAERLAKKGHGNAGPRWSIAASAESVT